MTGPYHHLHHHRHTATLLPGGSDSPSQRCARARPQRRLTRTLVRNASSPSGATTGPQVVLLHSTTPATMHSYQRHLDAGPGSNLSPHRHRSAHSPSLAEQALSIPSTHLAHSPTSSDSLFRPADFRPAGPYAWSNQSSTGFARHRAALYSHRDSLSLSLTPRLRNPFLPNPAVTPASLSETHEIVPRSPPILPCPSPVHPRRPRSRPTLHPSPDCSESLVLLKPPQPPSRPVSLPPTLDTARRMSPAYLARQGCSLDYSSLNPKLPRSFSFSPGTTIGSPLLTGSPDLSRSAPQASWNNTASPSLGWSPAMSMTSTAITDWSSPLRTSELTFDYDVIKARGKGGNSYKASLMSVSPRRSSERDHRHLDLVSFQTTSPKTRITPVAHISCSTSDAHSRADNVGPADAHLAGEDAVFADAHPWRTGGTPSVDSHHAVCLAWNAERAECENALDIRKEGSEPQAMSFSPISLGTSMSSPSTFSHGRRMSGLQPLLLRPSPANSPKKHESVISSTSLPTVRRIRRSRPHALVLYSSSGTTPEPRPVVIQGADESVEGGGGKESEKEDEKEAEIPAKAAAMLGMQSPKTGSMTIKLSPMRPKRVAALGVDAEATPPRVSTVSILLLLVPVG